jgi:predicted ATPase
VTILATSREGLGVADEQLWLVPSLDLGAGIESAAMDLFVERARSVASGFALTTTDEARAVVEICRRLDGIPLAIELAASRMASMTAIEVGDRLDHRFRLLVGPRRGLERHQTLRHAVAWSHELLDDTEKTLLARCSVFAGGFDLAAACAVGGCGDDLATLDVLDALVRKSLLVADRSSGRTRFSMLETIRQFAEEQLVASGSVDEPGPPMLATSPGAKPTSWHCGTAPDRKRRIRGSPWSWPICAPRSDGPPSTATSTPPRPSP